MPLLVQGKLEAEDSPKILVNHILKLEEAERGLSSQLRVRVHDREVTTDRMAALRGVLPSCNAAATAASACRVLVRIAGRATRSVAMLIDRRLLQVELLPTC